MRVQVKEVIPHNLAGSPSGKVSQPHTGQVGAFQMHPLVIQAQNSKFQADILNEKWL